MYVVFLILSLGIIVVLGMYVRNVQISAQESSALYGGQAEAGYPSAGFLIGYMNTSPSELCGIVYLNSSTAISAAHCLDKSTTFTSGVGALTVNRASLYDVVATSQHPEWDHRKSANDIARITMDQRSSGLLAGVSAKIVSPKESCNYRIVAYGRTESDTAGGLSLTRERKGADVCITYFDDNLLYINSGKGGVCVGDSGSPIYEKDTNNVVGIISAIIVKDKQQSCYIGNTAIAVRLDAKRDFIQGISTAQPTPTATQPQATVAEFSKVTFSSDSTLLQEAQKFLVKYGAEVEIALVVIGGVIVSMLTLAIFRRS